MFDPFIILQLIILLFSVIIHELAHGSVAYSLGDPTAKYSGRLTLNPLKHLDLFGSVVLPLLLFIGRSPFLIGWAKPVPTNPYNFKDKKYGNIKVSLAGPASNILLALFFGLFIRFIIYFNLLPPIFFISGAGQFFSYIVLINLRLAIFNLIPIPPLDGSWILFSFLSDRLQNVKIFLRQYGVAILIFLLIFGSLQWFLQISFFLFSAITGL